MAMNSDMSYHITCDECGDPVIDNEGLTYCHFTTQGAVDYAVDSDWLITDDGHWCPDCRAKHEREDEAAGKTKTGSDDDESSDPID